MIHLDFLGGVSVTVGGRSLSGRATQPRRLAVLAVLAASPRCATTRDRLVALLWPETSERRARKLLATSIYELRRALGPEVIGTAGDRLELDPRHVRSDVARFRELATSDPEAAVGLYRGPFLDGFHVREAATFTEWVEGERRDLARLHGAALEAAAGARAEAGDVADAIRLLRRLTQQEPTDPRVARALMEALAASGDPAAAIEHSRRYTLDLEERYGIAPDPEVLELADRLREEGAAGAEAPPDPRAVDPLPARATPASEHERPSSHSPHRSRRRWAVLAAGAAAALALVVAAGRSGPEEAPAGSRVFVVAPFRVTAPDTTYDYLREGAVDLVNALLTGGSLGHVVDSRTVLRRWPEEMTPLDPGSATQAARDLGANRLIQGEMTATTRRLTLTGRMVRVGDGEVIAEAVEVGERGGADELTLLERLVGRLLAAEEGDPRADAVALSDSLGAVRAYLEGHRAQRLGQWVDSYDHYERALAIDSSFAVAAAAQVAAGWHLRPASEAEWIRVLTRAWRLRDRLGPADRALTVAQVGASFPRLSTWREQIEAARAAVRLNPHSADAFAWLGGVVLLWGASAGVPDWHEEATGALDRAIALDSGSVEARIDRLYAAIIAGDTADVREKGNLFLRHSPRGDRTAVNRWLMTSSLGEAGGGPAALVEMSDLELEHLVNFAILIGLPFDEIEAELDRRIAAAGKGQADRCRALRPRIAVAAARGQARLAHELARSARPPGCGSHLAMTMFLTEPSFPPVLEHYLETNPPNRDSPSHRCFARLHRLLGGDTTGARAGAAELRRVGEEAPPTPYQRIGGHHVCARLIETGLALETAADRRRALRGLEGLLEEGVEWEVPAGANMLLARWLEEAGDPTAALRAVRRRSYGWNTTFTLAVPGMLREEGRLAAAVGDTVGAVRAYRHYLTLRDRPDTDALRDERARVERHLRRLEETGKP